MWGQRPVYRKIGGREQGQNRSRRPQVLNGSSVPLVACGPLPPHTPCFWFVAPCIPSLAAWGCPVPPLVTCGSLHPIFGGLPTSLLSSGPNKELIPLIMLGVGSTPRALIKTNHSWPRSVFQRSTTVMNSKFLQSLIFIL